MYSILRAEMYKTRKTVSALSADIGVSEKTLRNKLNGETAFTWPEAQSIYRILKPEMTIDELFRRDDEIHALAT